MDKQTVRLIFIHLLMLSVFWTGTSAAALVVAFFFFVWRGLGLTIAYHRYFTHRSFKTSRAFQFFLAFAGSMCMQRGALWWAANHRRHHQYSDTENDPHSPVTGSFWHAHMGWALEEKAFETDYSRVRDFDAFPELRWLNEHSDLVHGIYATFLFLLGEGLKIFMPQLSTSGLQFLVWGYLIGGIAHLHTIFLINSWAHIYGKRPYPFPAREGRDNSHNVGWLALLTFGEGWHYNHHCFPMSARIGLAWWEIDFGWWVIKILEKLGIVWDVKTAKRPISS
ncbi:MAG: acyl-CoA desaturase [Bacteriovoracaceae bacterium]|nr:acyl-CoA desaturase [Bacteriovoracaceae bacterium]